MLARKMPLRLQKYLHKPNHVVPQPPPPKDKEETTLFFGEKHNDNVCRSSVAELFPRLPI